MKHTKNKLGETILAYLVLIVLSFLCLFFFYILLVNATRSHADLQKGFSWLPGNYFLENLKNVANDGSFPMFKMHHSKPHHHFSILSDFICYFSCIY